MRGVWDCHLQWDGAFKGKRRTGVFYGGSRFSIELPLLLPAPTTATERKKPQSKHYTQPFNLDYTGMVFD
ncbi:hypothetical protein RIF29_41779 [Crotalaria pallida]|uniref:Uncharacterized protein n=1 Tax=Crotalaria pallida TaxID=3830 RepID=A0AAN9E8Q0_CROPI